MEIPPRTSYGQFLWSWPDSSRNRSQLTALSHFFTVTRSTSQDINISFGRSARDVMVERYLDGPTDGLRYSRAVMCGPGASRAECRRAHHCQLLWGWPAGSHHIGDCRFTVLSRTHRTASGA